MVGRKKSCLESNPIPVRDAQKAQAKPCGHQDLDTPQRLSQTCSSISCGGMGQQWPVAGAGALNAADLGNTPCGISPLGGGHH